MNLAALTGRPELAPTVKSGQALLENLTGAVNRTVDGVGRRDPGSMGVAGGIGGAGIGALLGALGGGDHALRNALMGALAGGAVGGGAGLYGNNLMNLYNENRPYDPNNKPGQAPKPESVFQSHGKAMGIGGGIGAAAGGALGARHGMRGSLVDDIINAGNVGKNPRMRMGGRTGALGALAGAGVGAITGGATAAFGSNRKAPPKPSIQPEQWKEFGQSSLESGLGAASGASLAHLLGRGRAGTMVGGLAGAAAGVLPGLARMGARERAEAERASRTADFNQLNKMGNAKKGPYTELIDALGRQAGTEGAISGGIIGAGGGALTGALTGDPKKRLRRALLGALLGGGIGATGVGLAARATGRAEGKKVQQNAQGMFDQMRDLQGKSAPVVMGIGGGMVGGIGGSAARMATGAKGKAGLLMELLGVAGGATGGVAGGNAIHRKVVDSGAFTAN